jgi:hypothetical protein
MKTITLNVMILAILLFSYNVQAQTYVYNESVQSGIFFQGTDGAEVSNPVSDDVNSSATCAMSSTDGNWQQLQFFPTFSPTTGDKFFFSVYNPNDVGPGQIQFEYSSAPGTWQYGGDVSYSSDSTTGWVEYSVNLDGHVGEEINKIVMMPAGSNSTSVYVDNIYFNDVSVLAPPSSGPTYVYDENVSSGIFFQGTDGAEVSNPVSDDVNSSATCAMSSTDGNWQQVQFFPVFSPSTGDKLFFSVYNPNDVGPGQIQFEYTSAPGTWQYGGDVTYSPDSTTSWVEYSVNLDGHVGEEINKIVMMPAGPNSTSVYIDNIYFNDSSVLTPPSSGTTYVYNEDVSSGMFFESGNGAEMGNPVSDAVNSSANCAFSGTDNPFPWLEIQYFPSPGFTASSGDKMFFSVYNPNSSPGAQIQFNSGAFFGGNVTYDATNTSGWVEYSIDLDDEIGNEITQVILYPTEGTSIGVYIDNIYFANSSVLSTNTSTFIEEGIFINRRGNISFERDQNNTEVFVFDITGRLIFRELVNGKSSERTITNSGVYIVKAVNENGITTKKLGF